MDYFILIGHICIGDKDHQMSFKIHTNDIILSSCACSTATFSFSILFHNVNNNFKGLHKLQEYFKSI